MSTSWMPTIHIQIKRLLSVDYGIGNNIKKQVENNDDIKRSLCVSVCVVVCAKNDTNK